MLRGSLMLAMVAATLYDSPGPVRWERRSAARTARCRVALLTQLSEHWQRAVNASEEVSGMSLRGM